MSKPETFAQRLAEARALTINLRAKAHAMERIHGELLTAVHTLVRFGGYSTDVRGAEGDSPYDLVVSWTKQGKDTISPEESTELAWRGKQLEALGFKVLPDAEHSTMHVKAFFKVR